MSKEPWHIPAEERIEKETECYYCHSASDRPSYRLQCKHNKAHCQKNFIWLYLWEYVKSYPSLVCPDRNAYYYCYQQQVQDRLHFVVLEQPGWIYNEYDCIHQQDVKRSLPVRRKSKRENLEYRNTCCQDSEDKEELLDPIMLEKSSNSLEVVVVIDVYTHLFFEFFKLFFVESFYFSHKLSFYLMIPFSLKYFSEPGCSGNGRSPLGLFLLM